MFEGKLELTVLFELNFRTFSGLFANSNQFLVRAYIIGFRPDLLLTTTIKKMLFFFQLRTKLRKHEILAIRQKISILKREILL